MAAATAAMVTITLSACGLEQYPDLLSSPVKDDPLPGAFRFLKTADNGDPVKEPDFLGFELYYKIYAFGDDSTINADVAAIGSQSDLSSRQFRRLHRASDRVGSVAKPVIEIAPADRGRQILLTVDFSGDLSSSDYPVVTLADSVPALESVPVEDLRRDVTRTDPGLEDTYKTFVEFQQGDADITYNSEIWSDISVPSPVTLVLYVVSYGKDVLNNRELFSRPVWLDDITVTFQPKS